MKYRGSGIIIIIVLMLLQISPIVMYRQEQVLKEKSLTGWIFTQSYEQHAPMNISSNADFLSLGWNGSGTENDPYTFSGYSFDAKSAIRIVNTSAFFVLSNCIFSYEDQQDTAIYLENVINGNISNCSIYGYGYALRLTNVSQSQVQDNSIEGGMVGISAVFCQNVIIDLNKIRSVSFGMHLGFLNESSVAQNTLSDASIAGMSLSGNGYETLVSDNYLSNASLQSIFGGAIQVMGSGWTITTNTISKSANGFYLALSDSLNISSNIVDNCFLAMELESVSSSRILKNNIRNCFRGIYASGISEVQISQNTIATNQTAGLELYDSYQCDIYANQLTGGGFEISGSSPSTYTHSITENTINDRRIVYLNDQSGVTLEGSYGQLIIVNSENITVRNAEIQEGCDGITIAFSSDCAVENSNISGNRDTGILAQGSENLRIVDNVIKQNGFSLYSTGGILLISGNNTLIERNLIYCNNGSGIALSYAEYSTIYNNLVANNTQYGIALTEGSRFNKIYGNSIGWNSISNSYDAGSDNEWCDEATSLGNWWSDFDESTDEEYPIPGTAGSTDCFAQTLTNKEFVLPIQDISELYVIAYAGLAIISLVIVVVIIVRKKWMQ